MSVSINFEGKVAMVTGAARGIGAASAKAFAEAGAKVVITDLLPEVENIAAEINAAGGEAIAIVGDISNPQTCKKIVDTTMTTYGRLDYAFNNAGISGNPNMLADVPEQDWNSVISINLSSVFHCMHEQLPAMLKNGGGVIINSSSVCGMRPMPGMSPYVAAKHGVIGITRSTALDYAGQGIRCLAIGPGYIETAMTDGDKGGILDEETKASMLPRIPQGRYGSPEDVAKAVRMLCSDGAVYINGAYIQIDGGMLQSMI